MGFVCDNSGSSRFGTNFALLSAYNFSHEWRTDQAGARTLVSGNYSALSDNAAGGTWTQSQSNPVNRPALVSVPPDEAQGVIASTTYLETSGTADGLDPTADLTMVCALNTTGSTGAVIRTAFSLCSTTTAAKWELGYSATAGGIAIWRRTGDSSGLIQRIPVVASGPMVLIGVLTGSTMKISFNGGALDAGSAVSGTFTHTGVRTVIGAAHTSSGVEDVSENLLGFFACKQAAVSDADCLGIYNILHPIFG